MLRGFRSSAFPRERSGPRALRVTEARGRPVQESDFFTRAASNAPLREVWAVGPAAQRGADRSGLRQPGGRCAQAHTQGHQRALESTAHARTVPASRGGRTELRLSTARFLPSSGSKC